MSQSLPLPGHPDGATIICADALEALPLIASESVALVVTSPPYFRHRDYGVEGQIGREATLDEYLSRIGTVLRELLRVVDRRGCCFWVVGDTYRQGRLALVPQRTALLADELGWVVRNDLIWSKADPPPESPRNRWRSGHEHVLFLTKHRTGYRFNSDVLRVPYAPATLQRWGNGQAYGGNKSRTRRRAGDSRMRDGQTFQLNPRGCLPRDVWNLPCANASSAHYAAFPEALVRPMLEACTDPGDLVLDPFVGTGTTCAVARKLQRRSLGIELNPEYAAIAMRAAGVDQP